MEYNGGAVVAMTGKNCVAISCDKRLGMQALTVSMDFPKIFSANNQLFYGLTGLASDIQTVYFYNSLIFSDLPSFLRQ